MAGLITVVIMVGLVAFIIIDHRRTQSDLVQSPRQIVQSIGNRMRPRQFLASLWTLTKVLFWIAVGVPVALITILLCCVFPPLIIGVVIILVCVMSHYIGPYSPATATRPSSNNDLLTGLIVGYAVGESIHHHHD